MLFIGIVDFASSFDELTATIFIAAPTTITLPVRIYMSRFCRSKSICYGGRSRDERSNE
jgi:ABC-type spermidine/putrescine transport system permease subunit II